jgi:hypothetical protein
MEPSPKDIEWLLEDLCTKLGFSMAGRDPDRFIALVHQGPDIFADAVLLAEGLDPNDPALDKRLRRGVHEFVAARFELWTSRGAPDQLPDPSAESDGRKMNRTQRRRFGDPFTTGC